jgi:hypothetical protein
MPDIEYSKIVSLAKEEFENATAEVTDTETTLSVAIVPDRRLGFLEPLGEFRAFGVQIYYIPIAQRLKTKSSTSDSWYWEDMALQFTPHL